ncbi:GM10781 [Drosophila sechellia]|uniref:GM10781 n=1 Tax=Drosophila sechellia TaxID=7238 RepID=B4I3U3_DROSE|nr:GM10781 [Drosophila sechellia]
MAIVLLQQDWTGSEDWALEPDSRQIPRARDSTLDLSGQTDSLTVGQEEQVVAEPIAGSMGWGRAMGASRASSSSCYSNK